MTLLRMLALLTDVFIRELFPLFELSADGCYLVKPVMVITGTPLRHVGNEFMIRVGVIMVFKTAAFTANAHENSP